MILDWYHLCKKLRQLLSMIAVNQAEKAIHLKFLIPQIWLGLVDNAWEYLRTQVTVRNQQQWSELIGYLKQHHAEIINYNRRRRPGKTIGRGRMDQGVDLTVGPSSEKESSELETFGQHSLESTAYS